PGKIVDMQGNVLGTHPGVLHYTIGQRRGLGIGGLSEPLYVVRLDADTREVVVGPKSALATKIVPMKKINWIGPGDFQSMAEREVQVRIRSTRPPRRAILRPTGPREAEVE